MSVGTQDVMSPLYPDEHLISSPRTLWWNPDLNGPHTGTRKDYETSGLLTQTNGSGDQQYTPNLVSSLRFDGLHSPALDIDFPFATVVDRVRDVRYFLSGRYPEIAEIAGMEIIRSVSASGNIHLYIPHMALEWVDYVRLLVTLVDAELVDVKYLMASLNRSQTLLRLPGVEKPIPTPDKEKS